MITVITNGCFDNGLHIGHYNILSKCRALAGPCGRVIVLIDTDKKIKKDKNKKPHYSHSYRKLILENLMYPYNGQLKRMVNEVFAFETNENLYELIKTHKPNYIVKGKDWENNVIGSDLAEVVYEKLYATTEDEEKISTSNLRKNLFKIVEDIA